MSNAELHAELLFELKMLREYKATDILELTCSGATTPPITGRQLPSYQEWAFAENRIAGNFAPSRRSFRMKQKTKDEVPILQIFRAQQFLLATVLTSTESNVYQTVSIAQRAVS